MSTTVYSWDFSGENALQRFESVNTSFTATTAVPTTAGPHAIEASLPYTLDSSGSIDHIIPVVVDNDSPTAAFTYPAANQIIGGGTTAVVVGGVSNDTTSWIERVDVTLPGQGTVSITDETSPWAATWTLPPTNGQYTLSVQAVDVTGQVSSNSTVQVLVDNYAPTADLGFTDGQAISGSGGFRIDIPLSGSASDNDPGAAAESGLTLIQLSLDGAPWRTVWQETGYPTTASWNTVWSLNGGESAQGEHSVRARAFDRAGNAGTIVEKTIVVDLLPPTDEQTDRTLLTDPPHYSGTDIPLEGVANDGGNLPLAPVATDLAGTLQSIDDATIWLQADSFAEISNNMQATWIGDFNGDRLSDMALGLPAANGGDGKVVIIHGAAGDWPVPDVGVALDEATTSLTGLSGSGLGQTIAPAGDVNGDNYADLLIGDFANDRVFLLFGSFAGRGTDVVLDGFQSNDWVELSTSTGETVTAVSAAGDVNNDGLSDILMSVASGEAYLLLGEVSPTWTTVEMDVNAAAVITTSGGATVAGVGDVDNDLNSDFAVGHSGKIYLYDGQIGLSNFNRLQLATGDALTSFNSSDSSPAIVGLGDINGDDIDDFVYSNGNNPTAVFGNSLSTQNISFSPAANGFIAAAGDVDRDGKNDMLLGNSDGNAYLVLGNNLGTAAATLTGVDRAASAPYAAGADVNSDGASDLLLVPSATAAADAGLEGFGTLSQITQSMLPVASPQLNGVNQVAETPVALLGMDDVQGPPAPAAFGTAASAAPIRAASQAVAAITHYVNDDGGCSGNTPCYTTIQAAVNAAAAGDTITVYPGVYGSVTVSTNNLTIQSATLADAVFIDGAGGTFAVKISNAAGVTLSKLTLRNAQYGLWLENAGTDGWETAVNKITAQNLFIHDFTTHAVYMNRDSSLTLAQTTLVGTTNHIGVYGTSSSNAAWDSGTNNANLACVTVARCIRAPTSSI